MGGRGGDEEKRNKYRILEGGDRLAQHGFTQLLCACIEAFFHWKADPPLDAVVRMPCSPQSERTNASLLSCRMVLQTSLSPETVTHMYDLQGQKSGSSTLALPAKFDMALLFCSADALLEK